MKSMTSRERVLTAIHLQLPDRVPREILFEPRVARMLRERLNTPDLVAALRMDVVSVFPSPTRLRTNFTPYFQTRVKAGEWTRDGKPVTPDGKAVSWDEWGRGRIWDLEEHYAEYLYPLERSETADEILAYPWPDLFEPYRYADLKERVDALHARGYAVIGDVDETVFEIAWQLRSMDRLFEDMLHNDEKAALVLDAITDRIACAARAMAEAGVDILYTGDDVAMQTGLMMSRKFYRQWLFPRLKRVVDAAREVIPGLPVQYHSDGKINDLVPDLMEAGVTILNPVQPECVDHAWIKAAYGDRLSFNGGLGVQSVLPFGTPEQVREHVRQVIHTLGAGGGLIIAPSHVIERDTPMENILAMMGAIDEFGRY
jgi:uroporphyrinogen decarboxylase